MFELFPIQQKVRDVFESKLFDNDLVVSAPTGTGKTLAYVLPIAEKFKNVRIHMLRALVLVPTRDLVHQVVSVFQEASELNVLGIASGEVTFKEEQTRMENCDVLVATPGRLMDHLNETPDFTLEYLQFLVLDEADRLLASFSDVISLIIKKPQPLGRYPKFEAHKPIKMLFSATATDNPEKIAALHLFKPLEIIEEAHFSVPATLKEYYVTMNCVSDKPTALVSLLTGHLKEELNINPRTVIVFTKGVDSARKLAAILSQAVPIKVHYFSREVKQSKRANIISQLSSEEYQVVVASDVISRGIDLLYVDLVVNYDHPIYLPQYVHRVGRTARAGAQGTAVSLIASPEAIFFKTLMSERGEWKEVVKQVRFKPSRKEKDNINEVLASLEDIE